MLTIFGTIALDTTRTRTRTVTRIMGGAATYSSLSASKYVSTNIVGIIGSDFPMKYREILSNNVNTKGLVIKKNEKTFHYDSSFDETLTIRTSNKTELNVIENFQPIIPEEYIDSKFIFLANNDPVQNMKMLDLFSDPQMVVCDTIEYWIHNKFDKVVEMMKRVNGIIIDAQEARLLTKEHNLIKCAKKIKEMVRDFVIIKKGEHGSMLFYNDIIFLSPAFPIEIVVDPTGAGDCFAGGFLGYLAKNRKISESAMKEGAVYGNIMGSFVVEDYGVNRMIDLTNKEIEQRVYLYKSFVDLQ